MPSFTEYSVPVDVDVDIEVDEFLDECDDKEIEEVIRWLKLSGYTLPTPESQNIFDDEWNNTLEKLVGIRLRMSEEDIETIRAIAKKY